MSAHRRSILYLGNFDDRSYEGLITLLRNLQEFFSRRYLLFINDWKTAGSVDIINIHTSGFLESLKFRSLKGKKIYSLHSNIMPVYFKIIRDYAQWFGLIYSRESDSTSWIKLGKRMIYAIVSNFTPLWIKRRLLQSMEVVVLPSKWLQDTLRLPNGRIIRQGINVRRFKKKNKKKEGGKIRVAYFGHPTPDKGFLEVISVFAQLDSKIFTKVLFPTMANKRIERRVMNADKTIMMGGFVKDIVKEYNQTAVLVLPYRHSSGAISTPLVLIESMACECAVITSDLPHLREICGDSVIYVKPYDVDGIVEAICQLANDSNLRKKLGKRARERVVKYYNQEKMFKEYDLLYRELFLNNDDKLGSKRKG